jgi:UDP:flavonoid glycosyltransferase YjiC (YdhE family)
LKAELEKLGLGEHVHIYGFVNNMEELMGASDLVITKAGPGTLMEALVIGRPVIVTEAIGMQERGNIDFVLNHELGAFCPTTDRIVPAVGEIMQPETYAATVARLRDAVPRDGATEIAQLLIDRLRSIPPKRRNVLPTMVFRLRQLGRQLRFVRNRNRTGAQSTQNRRVARWRRRPDSKSDE